jgi:hypothetical protein
LDNRGGQLQDGARKNAVGIANAANAFLKMTGRTRREFVTPVPRSVPGGYVSMIVSPLLNKKREEVGEIRVVIYVQEDDGLPVRVMVEWTRNAFGFWYRMRYVLDDKSDLRIGVSNKLRDAMYFVKVTADGTVRVASMNRSGIEKVRKSRTIDRAARVGMMMG